MKHVFVGDIHGKVEEVEKALAKDGLKIFVGDFIDSFTRSVADHEACLELALTASEKGEAKLIYGNHELSYLMPRHRCSGWKQEHMELMLQFSERIDKQFIPHLFITPQFLVTHAGLTNQIWKRFNLGGDDVEARLNEWWTRKNSPLHWIGHYRGGPNEVGGTFWCDWNVEFEPVPGLTQVFGHTAGKGIRCQFESSYCIDCLDNEHSFLEMDL